MRELARVRSELIGMSVRRHVVRHYVHASHFVLLLPLHPSVLEPDLYLPLRETESVRYLDASSPREVPIEMELLFEFQGLIPRVRSPLSFRFPVRVHRTLTDVNPFHPGVNLWGITTTSIPLIRRVVSRAGCARGRRCR